MVVLDKISFIGSTLSKGGKNKAGQGAPKTWMELRYCLEFSVIKLVYREIEECDELPSEHSSGFSLN